MINFLIEMIIKIIINYVFVYINNIIALYKVGYDRIYYSSKTTDRIFPKASFASTYSAFFSEPTFIIDNVFLGSAFNAANINHLKKFKIRLILNITPDISNYYIKKFKYVKYLIQDDGIDKLTEHCESSYNEIINSKQNVLVHCFMGASRSVSIVAYYLMKTKGFSPDEAIKFIQSKRPIINPSKAFYSELKEIYKKI
jgi:hypothetical protein